jgi:hypothetical protein
MRVLVDLVDSFAGIVRLIIVAVMVFGFGVAVLLAAGASYVAPKVAEDLGDRTTELGERVITEAREAQREHELAQDGWGYGSANSSSSRNRVSSSQSRDRRGPDTGGWGDEAQ